MSKVRKFASALVLALVVMVSTFGVAFAHHDTYEASRTCDGHWTASAQYIGGGEKRLVLISEVVINGVKYDPSWSNAPSGSGGTPPRTNGVIPREDYNGSQAGLPETTPDDFISVGVSEGWTIFDLSGSNFSGSLTDWYGAIEMYSWDNDHNKWVRVDQDFVYMPQAPDNCAKPSLTPSFSCDEEGAGFKMMNDDGGTDAHFTILVNGDKFGDYTIAPNQSQSVVVPIAEDTTVTIEVLADYGFHYKNDFHRDCEAPPAKPKASVSTACTEHGFMLTLSNKEGGSPFTFGVSFGNTTPKYYTVGAGEELQVEIPAQEDQPLSVSVFGDNYSKLFQVIKNCEGTYAELTYYCGLSNNAIAVFYNTSNIEQTFSVKLNDVDASEVVVPAKSQKQVEYPISEDESLNLKAFVDGQLVSDLTVTRNCEGVDFDLTYNCGEEAATATLTNTSDVDLYFHFESNVMTATIRVAANTVITEPVIINEDQTVTATVTVEKDGRQEGFEKTVAVTRDCQPNPSVKVFADCKVSEDNLRVMFANDGGGFVIFTIKYVNETSQVGVGPHDQQNRAYPLPATVDQSFRLVITAPGMDDVDQLISGCGQPTNLPEEEQPNQRLHLLLPQINN